MKWKAAEAMTMEGSAAGNAMGMGMGAGLGMQMGNMTMASPWGGQAPAAAAPPPPPPPVEHVWHIADAGKVSGPYSKAKLGRMVTEGALSRDSMVWTQGQDGWMKAGDVNELAQLFTVMPPPPPGA